MRRVALLWQLISMVSVLVTSRRVFALLALCIAGCVSVREYTGQAKVCVVLRRVTITLGYEYVPLTDINVRWSTN